MSIAEVNAKLDQLSTKSKEGDQLKYFEEFYRRMNPEELMWLIRIILRQTVWLTINLTDWTDQSGRENFD
jgi:DNA ligase N terminus